MRNAKKDLREIAQKIEDATSNDDFDEMFDYFMDAVTYDVRDDGSVKVMLTYGPTIWLDTKTEIVHCCHYDYFGEYPISKNACKSIDEFFEEIAC